MEQDERRGGERRGEWRGRRRRKEGVNVIDTIQRGDDNHGENLEMGKGKRKREEREEEEEEDRQQARVVGEESWKGRGRKSFPFGLMGGAAVSLSFCQPYGLSGNSHSHRPLALLFVPFTGACLVLFYGLQLQDINLTRHDLTDHYPKQHKIASNAWSPLRRVRQFRHLLWPCHHELYHQRGTHFPDDPDSPNGHGSIGGDWCVGIVRPACRLRLSAACPIHQRRRLQCTHG
ncbi:uncharacterized protein BO88DRAFT_75664 [Aspergillus vadensis CBS 113365]|uniref:Uncharacterized protein n=1 Tax=Aspergillus vadensis (strain CBS 113365 / IMI 142717 / IBT 24658) TaxID=1448311 RepID=A0A319B6U4_ASPVC|nr:hypothetical protein BO88DRAFT_75664 [Aspergillus vadensis CBS 113365]PYH67611.1 hypothetical protein BO88DRAFT_75664 [Aspergillus vadensis CBS 113365]